MIRFRKLRKLHKLHKSWSLYGVWPPEGALAFSYSYVQNLVFCGVCGVSYIWPVYLRCNWVYTYDGYKN